MKQPSFLADECCDFWLVKGLRQAGYDVKAIAEEMPGATDVQVSELANHEARVLLTEDRDFGQLVFAGASETAGVIYIRYPTGSRNDLRHSLIHLVEKMGHKLIGRFVVLQPGRIRIKSTPH